MVSVATALVAFAVFLAIYEWSRRRAAGDDGVKPPLQWGWLAAIAGCTAAALVIGLATN